MNAMMVVAGGRQTGRTTALLRWMREAAPDEVRVLVSHNEAEAMRVYRSTWDAEGNPTDLASWQFVSVHDVISSPMYSRPAFHGKKILLAVDNLEMVLYALLHEVTGAVAVLGRAVHPVTSEPLSGYDIPEHGSLAGHSVPDRGSLAGYDAPEWEE